MMSSSMGSFKARANDGTCMFGEFYGDSGRRNFCTRARIVGESKVNAAPRLAWAFGGLGSADNWVRERRKPSIGTQAAMDDATGDSTGSLA